MRIIYHRNSNVVNRWRIDFCPNEKIENVRFVSRHLSSTAPEHPDFLQIQRIIELYCDDYNLKTKWCI